jgi:hypothetical protein
MVGCLKYIDRQADGKKVLNDLSSFHLTGTSAFGPAIALVAPAAQPEFFSQNGPFAIEPPAPIVPVTAKDHAGSLQPACHLGRIC